MSRTAHTVVYTFGGGRLGNQLIRLAHWLAWVEEHRDRVRIVDAGFWRYAGFFKHWNSVRGCEYPSPSVWAGKIACLLENVPASQAERVERRVLRAIQATGALLPGWQSFGNIKKLAEIDLEAPAFLAAVEQASVTTCAGWRIACWNLVEKRRDLIRQLLAPMPEIEAQAKNFVGNLRTKSDLVAGVLIRHGDYRHWQDGLFYFETAHYVACMRRYAKEHAHQQISFVVTSDEVHDPTLFAGLDVTFASGSANRGGRAVDAMFELAACDVILAPPSTFAAWASYWGRVPWWPIKREMESEWVPVEGDLAAARHHPVLATVVR